MPNIRKPNNIHKLNGTFRKDRHGDEGSTMDDLELGVLPPPPAFLGAVAHTEWHRVVDILTPAGLLKGSDYGIMIAYCQIFEQMSLGDVPAAMYTQFRGVANDLGLTPVSRSKLVVGKAPKSTGNPYGDL